MQDAPRIPQQQPQQTQQQPRNTSQPTSHRPKSISNNFAALMVGVGVGFMALDTFFTVKKGIKVFDTKDFLINISVAILWGAFCAGVQKGLFSIFVDKKRRNQFNQMWDSGPLGKAAVIMLGCVAAVAIHFSFTSTTQGLGITAKSLGINLPGQEFAASVGLIQLFLTGFVGLMVAFIDEICFMISEVIKD